MGLDPNLTHAQWRKSSYSGGTGGECIEVAETPAAVAIRDSKAPRLGTFRVSPEAFTAFVGAAARGRI
ncbi:MULTISPECIES: DUF397 domain-containing protein [unclassified Streptomyces]|uniref:DUF397 domain-containing protein n=1 Tax=unclassified Streptomyces TaxID=2593676 RepID=UPI002E33EB47|nr:DUF397 domain-containing protein [Streptomyces sp. NBC_01280]